MRMRSDEVATNRPRSEFAPPVTASSAGHRERTRTPRATGLVRNRGIRRIASSPESDRASGLGRRCLAQKGTRLPETPSVPVSRTHRADVSGFGRRRPCSECPRSCRRPAPDERRGRRVASASASPVDRRARRPKPCGSKPITWRRSRKTPKVNPLSKNSGRRPR